MALTATIHALKLELADADRGVYQPLDLRLARHPSETAGFLITRLLAYCLEYTEGIVLTEGVAAVDEPAVLVRDLTGRITAWIEVGTPDAERVHRGSKLAGRAAVYCPRDPAQWLASLAGRKIHRAAEIPLYSFDRGFVEAAAAALERRSEGALSVTGGQLYLSLNGRDFSSAVHSQRLS